MRIRAVWRGVREPGERLMGWALLLPGGRRVVIGSAFLLGVLVPVLLPCSVLVGAWAQGSGRRLGLLTDRRLILLRAGRGEPVVDSIVALGSLRVRTGDPGDPVRVWVGRGSAAGVDGFGPSAPERGAVRGWFRTASNGVEARFADAVRAMARAEAPDAVC